MTRIAIRAVVDIVAHRPVMRIHAGFVVLMAAGAGEDLVIVRVGVAVGAGGPCSGVVSGINGELAVREGRTGPDGGCVTSGTGRRKPRRHMVWVGDAGVVRLVASVTGCRRAFEDTPDVTAHTRDTHVRSGEGEVGRGMTEGGRSPGSGCMAHGTILRKTVCCMCGTRRAVVVAQMAGDARGAQRGILAVCMTSAAVQSDMKPRECELGARVSVLGSRPAGCGMAQRAVLRESSRCMIGIVCPLEVGQMTGGASCGSSDKSAIWMTKCAGCL